MSHAARFSRRSLRHAARRAIGRFRAVFVLPAAALLVVAGAVAAAPATAEAGATGEGRTWVMQAVDSPTQMWLSEDTGTSIVIIAPGDTVEWRFDQAGQGHDLTSLDTRTPWPTAVNEYRDIGGAAFSYTFDEPGMYEYICSLHGTLMTGMVVVQEGGGNQPPAATPVVAPTNGPAPLTVHFTANAVDPNDDELSYLWDFGTGGSQGTANHVMFEYTTPGTYTATLQVSDGRGGAFEQDFPITVTEEGETPDISATAAPTSGPAPLHVSFAAQAPGEHAHHYTYDWQFGDGSIASGISPEHIYTEPGEYTATVTVSDGGAQLGTADVHISVTSSALPAIEAKAARGQGGAPLQVEFATEVTTSGDFRSFSHGLTANPDLAGDGLLIRQRGATYASIDVAGLQPNRSHLVHVHEQPCDQALAGAHFRFDESQPFEEDNEIWLPFTSDADGRSGLVEVSQPQRAGEKAVSIVIHDPDNPALRIGCVDLEPSTAGLEYSWDFGDGSTGSGPDPDHTYDAPGSYTATATVSHGAGHASVSATVSVVVAGQLAAEAVASTRMLAGKAYVTVTVTNTNDVPVDVEITTAYGAKTFIGVQPGKKASVSMNSTLAAIPAGHQEWQAFVKDSEGNTVGLVAFQRP